MNIKILISKIKRYLFISMLAYLVFTIAGVLTYRILPVPFTPLMFQRIFDQIADSKKIHLKHKWVPIEQISNNMILAAIAAEDNKFTIHFGIDYEAIHKAYDHNKRGMKIRGASTISQQTSKNVFLWMGRNYFRKGLELYYTFLIEIIWGKERIMEVYLNSIEMGDGIYGVEAASWTYFHKPASKLNRSESALIVAAFPSPRKNNPAIPSKYLILRQQKILSLMNKLGTVSL